MAEVTIADLPAATAAAVTDVFEIEQGGASKKLTAELLRAFIGGGLQNRLINGEFRIWQRGISLAGQADDAYTADRWYILTQTGTIADARQADPWGGATHAGRMTQSQASAQRMGRAQIVEGKNCKDLRGQAVTFYGQARISSGGPIRVAILENTGTEDTVTSDVVDDWTDGAFAAGNFFIAGVTVAGVAEYASPGTGVFNFAVTGTLSTSLDNAIVMLWTEDEEAQNVTLDMGNCGLVRGSAAPAVHVPRSFGDELALCQRYYQKSFALDTAPAQSVAGNAFDFTNFNTGAASMFYQIRFPTRMRAGPTMTLYNPNAANGEVRNITDGADCTNASVTSTSELAATCGLTTNAAATPGDLLRINFSAAAEL